MDSESTHVMKLVPAPPEEEDDHPKLRELSSEPSMHPEFSHSMELPHAASPEEEEDGLKPDAHDMEDYSSEYNMSTGTSDEEGYVQDNMHDGYTTSPQYIEPSSKRPKAHVNNNFALAICPPLPKPPSSMYMSDAHGFSGYPQLSKSFATWSPESLSDPKHFGPHKLSRLRIKEGFLRAASMILSMVGLSIMASTHQTRMAAGSTFDVKFNDVQAFSYLVAINVISAIYSGVQLLMIAQPSNSIIFSPPTKLGICICVCDQILACMLFSASSSAATASVLARHGLRNIWPPACSTWKLWYFCTKAEIAVVGSFLAAVFMMMVSLLSGYYISRPLKE